MMRRAGVIILGILMVIGGSLWLFKDAYGKNIAGAAEDIAVNLVAVKINQSLKKASAVRPLRDSFCAWSAMTAAISNI